MDAWPSKLRNIHLIFAVLWYWRRYSEFRIFMSWRPNLHQMAYRTIFQYLTQQLVFYTKLIFHTKRMLTKIRNTNFYNNIVYLRQILLFSLLFTINYLENIKCNPTMLWLFFYILMHILKMWNLHMWFYMFVSIFYQFNIISIYNEVARPFKIYCGYKK